MTITKLAKKHNLEPESAKAFLREWVELTTEYCEQCQQPASTYIIYTNVSDTKHPICDCCARQHEQTAQEINQHEMDNFGGAYGLVTWAYEPLIARPTDLGE